MVPNHHLYEAAWSAAALVWSVVGALLLTEQSAAHLWGLPTSMIIVGVGVFLLSGKEGAEFVLWLLGRGGPPGGRGPGPP